MNPMNPNDKWSTLPEDWEFDRLKDIVEIRNEKVDVKSDQNNYLELENLESGTGKILSRKNTLRVESAVTQFKSGDVLFGKLRPYLEKYCQPDFDGYCTGEILAFKPVQIHGRYLFYCMGSDWLIQRCNAIAYGAKMPRINWPKQLSQFDIPFPILKEQKKIADYLDLSSERIDEIIAFKKKQFGLLDKLRDSIIQKTVTQGLVSNIEQKDSRIDWLGQIPKHWRVARIKRHATMIRGKFTHRPRNDPAFYNGPYPFFQTGNIASADKYITEYTQTLNDKGLAVSRMFPKGTIVMSIAANIGDVAITGFEGCFPDSIIGFVPDHHVDPDYLYYLLKSMKPIMLRSAILTTQLNINYVRIGANYCPYPPKEEQTQIARYLDQKMEELRRLSDNLTRQIDTLSAYRASLIHECVTGKRRLNERDLAKVGAHG